jgi:hypothetical protein
MENQMVAPERFSGIDGALWLRKINHKKSFKVYPKGIEELQIGSWIACDEEQALEAYLEKLEYDKSSNQFQDIVQEVINEMETISDLPKQWDKPIPFDKPLLSVLSVTPPMIPESLRPWLLDICNRMKCPLDFVASAAIVMLSSLIGTRLNIKPKARDDWSITPNLWGAAIGDPSAMKTPSVDSVFKPLKRIMAKAEEEFKEKIQSYEAKLSTYEAQKKVFQAQEQKRLKGDSVDNPVTFPEPIEKPIERRYMTNDSTIEKLSDLLNENPAGLLQYRDELIGLLAGWGKQGHEQDRAFYLEGWNGSGSISIDRMGRGTIHIKNLCLSLFGGIQPSKLLGYLKAATQYDNDGLVQRLQMAVYPDKSVWEYVDQYPDDKARDTAYALIEQVISSDFSEIAYSADENNRFAYTRFDGEAQEVFVQWLCDWEKNVLPNESGLMLEHLTKYRSLMPSLALIFHVVNCIGLPPAEDNKKRLVSLEATQMAIEWCKYLKSHAQRIYGLLDTQQTESALFLLRHLKAGHLKDGFKARDVQRKGWTNLTSLDTVESALVELIDHRWLKEVQPQSSNGGRPEAPHYLINPQIIQNA